MPTINTENISGFAEMTTEQKLDALLKFEFDDHSGELGRTKAALDKASSELAESKKQRKSLEEQLKGKLTDEEAAKLANSEELAAIKKQLDDSAATIAQLQKEKLEANYKAKYLATPGFDEKLAEDTAKALADGDMATVFANQQKATEAHEKALKAEWVKSDPKPGGSGGGEDGKSDAEKLAEKIGKNKAEAAKASSDVMKHYI